MKILALCSIKTQLWCFLKTKNSQKFLTWIWLNIFQLIMFKTWKKTQKRSKKDPQMKLPVHFTVLHIQKFSAISSNLVKIALFKGSFAPGNLEMAKYTWIYIKSGQKIPILTCNTFVDTFLPRALRYLYCVYFWSQYYESTFDGFRNLFVNVFRFGILS